MSEFGILLGEAKLDWATAVRRKDTLVGSYLVKKAESLRERGIDLVREPARFVDPHTIEVNGTTLRAGKVILASGSRPIRPPIPGLEHTIDSSEILALDRVPERLIVIGGGVIAMEFASIFGHAASKVTVLEAQPAILAGVEDDLRRAIEDAAPGWNVTIHTGVKVSSISRHGEMRVIDADIAGKAERLEADVVLLAAGRGPRVDGLDLERIGVKVEKKGVLVDDYLETSAPGVYAVGDVHGRFQLSPIADYEGKLAARNALEGNGAKTDYRVVPQTIFTIPAASSVGLTESEARESGIEVATSTLPFAKIGPAVIVGKDEGFVKVVFDKKSGELVGCHIFGSESEELIHEAALAMECRMTRDAILRTIPIHPSISEGFFGAVTSARTGHEESCCG